MGGILRRAIFCTRAKERDLTWEINNPCVFANRGIIMTLSCRLGLLCSRPVFFLFFHRGSEFKVFFWEAFRRTGTRVGGEAEERLAKGAIILLRKGSAIILALADAAARTSDS